MKMVLGLDYGLMGASWGCGRACLLRLTGFGVSWVTFPLVFLCLMSALGHGLSILRKPPPPKSLLFLIRIHFGNLNSESLTWNHNSPGLFLAGRVGVGGQESPVVLTLESL